MPSRSTFVFCQNNADDLAKKLRAADAAIVRANFRDLGVLRESIRQDPPNLLTLRILQMKVMRLSELVDDLIDGAGDDE